MNKRRANQKLRRKADLDKGLLNRPWHSKAYHRHFEGYTEVETVNPKGKVVIQRIYTGDYYRLDLPRKKRVGLRIVYALLWLAACALFGFAASRPIGANMTWYLAIVQMLTVCALAGLLFSLISHCTVPRDMTVGDWKSASVSLKRRAVYAALFLELNAFATGVYLLLKGDRWGAHLLVIALYVLSGLLLVVMNRLEDNAPYLTIPSTQSAPPEGSYIDA